MPARGGGHSSGGGGRSFSGGHSSHYSGGHSSFSSSSRGTYRTSRPSYGPSYGPRPYYTRGYGYGGYGYRRRGSIFSSVFIFIIALIIILSIVPMIMFSSISSGFTDYDYQEVTIHKERLEGYPFEYDLIDDKADLLSSSEEHQLAENLKYYYDQTGIQPYILISDEAYLSDSQMDDYTWDYYLDHFDSENYFLYSYFPYSNQGYDMYYVQGDDTINIMDYNAIDTFWNNIDSAKYDYGDRDIAQWIARGFNDTADTIMTVTETQAIPIEHEKKSSHSFRNITIGIGALIVAIAFFISRKKKKTTSSTSDIDYNEQYHQEKENDLQFNPYYDSNSSESYSDYYKNQNQ